MEALLLMTVDRERKVERFVASGTELNRMENANNTIDYYSKRDLRESSRPSPKQALYSYKYRYHCSL
jgi:hypothetical protein